MKLLRVHVVSAQSCGGLLDGLDLWVRSPRADYSVFDPLCFVGPNGSGKSQFLQALAEMLQTTFHACVPGEERLEANHDLHFELEYLIRPEGKRKAVRVRAARIADDSRRPVVTIQRFEDGEWINCDLAADNTKALLPRMVVGYTSGDNETLSLPFFVSRSGYADEVSRLALKSNGNAGTVPETRLMMIDYGTHLEVLAANLLLGTAQQRSSLLTDSGLRDIHSFRCIVQLARSPMRRSPARKQRSAARKGVQLTVELEEHLRSLQRCATCYSVDERTETYTFDYWINDATRVAFRHFWESALQLYSAFHKLAMLNDLAIPKTSRDRFKRETRARTFAARLPEPQDEEKVFRFERVRFLTSDRAHPVDYVSLSDGEHQQGQLFATLCMLSFPGVLFVLDEPESHFNPQWRVKCISRILELPTHNGTRGGDNPGKSAEQECLLTTHAPFVPSDMPRDKVFIFRKNPEGKIEVTHPDIETYGTTFDTILEECFGIRPPISNKSLAEIEELQKSNDPAEIKAGMEKLGYSVEKVFLGDRLRELTKAEET